ncbi:MAG: tRNA (adenosine(37)-N6)-threonylcarbamoyltransferase complex ATPase subunit type 1 TsaE [Clostridia bacterium]|nr:tRNA (adenosine(37)-N6)-threonylcarbamoyltransferase complex ATPase subunit type 1 TsaE [Clostridia bacterium]
MKTYVTKSERQTIKLGKKLAKSFFAGLTIVLNGELGAGKTAITKGFAKGLGVRQAVTSPTFTIMNDYKGKKLPLYHFDMYRIEDSGEAYEFGLTEYFIKSKNTGIVPGVSVIEWAQNIADLIPKSNLITIDIKKLDGDLRQIEVEESL